MHEGERLERLARTIEFRSGIFRFCLRGQVDMQFLKGAIANKWQLKLSNLLIESLASLVYSTSTQT